MVVGYHSTSQNFVLSTCEWLKKKSGEQRCNSDLPYDQVHPPSNLPEKNPINDDTIYARNHSNNLHRVINPMYVPTTGSVAMMMSIKMAGNHMVV
jgi:hypothetical protein